MIGEIKYFLFFCFLIFIISCSTKKGLKSKELGISELVQIIESNQLDFKDWTARGSVSFDSPDMGVSGSFVARIKRDSAIVLGFRKLGIEWARAMMDKHKYVVVNKWDKTVETKSLGEATQLINFNVQYADIENLLCGNVIIPNAATSQIRIKDNNYYLNFSEDGYDMEYMIDKSTLHITQSTIGRNGKVLAIMSWANYQALSNGKKAPFHRVLKVVTEGEPNTEIDLKISKIDLDDNGVLNFDIPNNYTKI